MSFERVIAMWGVATCWLYAGCIDVTCAERGTCSPGSSEETGEESSSNSSTSSRSSTSSGSEAGTTDGTTSVLLDAEAPQTSSTLSSDAQVCGDACACLEGSCGDSGSGGGGDICSPSQAAFCVAPEAVCVVESGLASCVECTVDDHCADGATVCVDRTCQVCDLTSHEGSHKGCSSAAPYCVLTPAAGSDAGVDGGALPLTLDASVAAGLDAGAALAADAGAHPGALRACVECRTSKDCRAAEAPFCTGGSCVECQTDEDCTDPAASQCDPTTLACVGCAAAGECAHLLNTPACDVDTATCVECTAAERVACGTNACNTVPGEDRFSCSEQPLGSVDSCEPCDSDAACEEGFGCVFETFNGLPTQWVCLPRQGDGPGEVDDCTSRPLVGSTETRSADSDEDATYCHPRRTTCAGYRSFGNNGVVSGNPESDWCTTDEECGLPGIDDGLCLPYQGNEDRGLCTYRCQLSVECNEGVNCAAISSGGSTFACILD